MNTFEEFYRTYSRHIHWDKYIYLNKDLSMVSQSELANIKKLGFSLKSNEIIFKYKFHNKSVSQSTFLTKEREPYKLGKLWK